MATTLLHFQKQLSQGILILTKADRFIPILCVKEVLNGAANIMRKVVADNAYKGIRKAKELMKRPILVTL